MGQYYKAVNIDKREYLSPHSFNCGAKLMESCYVGNDFVNALTALLTGLWHADRVMYIGDYAWNEVMNGRRSCSRAEVLQGLREIRELTADPFTADPYSASDSWHDAAEDSIALQPVRTVICGWDVISRYTKLVGSEAREGNSNCSEMRYVVNETLGVYYDRVALCSGDDCDLTLDPLLLFLAVGNGLGGGDYRSAEGAGLVGSWACQTISASNERPAGLREIFSPFDPNA